MIKNSLKFLSIPFTLLFLSGSINVFSHKFKVMGLKGDLNRCYVEYRKLISEKKVNCESSLCTVEYITPSELLDTKRDICNSIENDYVKAYNNMPIKF